MNDETKFGITIAKWVISGVLLLSVVFGSFGTIGAGERGIKTRFGAVVGTVEQGLYFKMPFVDRVHVMDVKTRTISYEKPNGQLSGASKDLQDVAIGIVVNYQIDPTKVGLIYASYSSVDNYEANVIAPIVRTTVKAISAQYTAEELVTKRAEFSDRVLKMLTDEFTAKNATRQNFNVTNVEFAEAFAKAIETKVTAVQNAEAQKNKLEQIKYEAQQTIETAKATAEAQRISAAALAAQGGADYVALKAIERWDGKLPVQMIPGQSVPFINVK